MMSGEFDYGSIFYPEGDGDEDPPPAPYYPGLTYAFFIVFFIFLGLILINVLLALTINDVNFFVEVAELKKTSLRLKFVLDMEKLLNSYVGMAELYCKKNLIELRQKYLKLSTNVNEESIENFDNSLRMWKQLLTEESRHQSNTEKLKVIESEVKKNNNRRSQELEETVLQMRESFNHSMQQLGMSHNFIYLRGIDKLI